MLFFSLEISLEALWKHISNQIQTSSSFNLFTVNERYFPVFNGKIFGHQLPLTGHQFDEYRKQVYRLHFLQNILF